MAPYRDETGLEDQGEHVEDRAGGEHEQVDAAQPEGAPEDERQQPGTEPGAAEHARQADG